jgi:hypothetical protein
MEEDYYEEKGIEDDLVVLNMSDLTELSMWGIIEALENSFPADENLNAIQRLIAFAERKGG